MTGRLRKPALILATLTVFFNLLAMNIGVALPTSHVQVDVFTQKQPYSGRGSNMPSDAFGPQETVYLYAEVLNDNRTTENMPVAFNIQTPSGGHFSISSQTNASGVATVNFTIATPPINITQDEVFGYWNVIATVLYADQVYSDTLIFRVDWIVKLLTVRTIDENLTYRSIFGNGGDVGLEITLRSIAKTLRNATISIVVKDELDFTVNFSLIIDFAVQPNEKLLYIYNKATLPKGAHIGFAKVFVSAFTAPVDQGGVPFCPSIQAEFYISSVDPLVIDLHDAALVAVLPSANPLEFGQGLTLTTFVRNEGTVTESFNVSTYFDGVLLGTGTVVNLPPYAVMLFYYIVNPSALSIGSHTISGSIPPVPKEADLTDNFFVDTVEVKSMAPGAAHDIAITGITLSTSTILVGESLSIEVTVVNKGNQSETFDLSIFSNSSLIETRQAISLGAFAQTTFTFIWDTSLMQPGFYQISAFAPLPQDANPSDNSLVDGLVEIKSGVPPQRVHDIAVLNVTLSVTEVNPGEIVNITVTVKNKGIETESFYVTVYYDHTPIGKKYVTNLEPSAETQILFSWNTSGVFPLKYVITAVADTVPGETFVADNTFVDGTVTISPYPSFLPPFEWLVISIVVIVALIAGIVLLLFLVFGLDRIRRRRRPSRPTYTIIAHPHI